MFIVSESINNNPVDARVLAYRSLRIVLVAVVLGLLLKLSCVDTVLIQTDQMTPTLRKGDRALVMRTAFRAPGAWFFSPKRNSPVLFESPFSETGVGCLRIAGLSGDTIRIGSGKLRAIGSNGLYESRSRIPADESPLPPAFSPRDSMATYIMPSPGDSFVLEELPLRDLLFLYALMTQENPKKTFTITPLFINEDSVLADFAIEDFALYSGPADSIPAEQLRDWFFWERLQAFLDSGTDGEITINLLINENKMPLLHYTLRHNAYFLLADNWVKGMDSRYYGPVSENKLRGRIASVLWSFEQDSTGSNRIRANRIVKIIR